ncbi:MAG: NUDIX domain-containing protein [Chitinivibrionales bacterium]|nr:NUDIX domain-containing protein [Chitinivibrionales bacterium]
MSDWQDEPKVVSWRSSLTEHGTELKAMTPEWLYHKPNGELLFGAFSVDAVDKHGHKFPSVVVLRGHAVVVVPVLRNRDTGEERFLAILQPRIGNGQTNLEFPAGMLDRQVDDPRGVAARELHEETGLAIAAQRLRLLHPHPLHTSVGLLDEGIYFYGCSAELSDHEYRSYDNRRSGSASENEQITTVLRTAAEIRQQAQSVQTILGVMLFDARSSTEPPNHITRHTH